MTDNNKPTVVDDFFSALFANDNNKLNNKEPVSEEPKEQEPDRPQDPYRRLQTQQEQQQHEAMLQGQEMKQTKKYNYAKKHETELDEFDEYSLLSSKRKLDDATTHSGRQVPSKKRAAAPDTNSILSKKNVDWSDVSPESRMLIRQLPARVDKEDVMDYFSTYGEVLEVVFKNTFGFVQFDSPFACANAVQCENGKKFKGITLELEICRTKPYFAREDDRHRQKLARPGSKIHRRNDDHFYNRRPENRHQAQQKYADDTEYDPRHPEISLNTQIPMVKIIAWNNVSQQFISCVENEFRKKNVSVATVILQFPNTRESLVKQMAMEGVKAVVTINRDLESQRKVSLQVFTPNTTGRGIRFDEYDSILGEQAAEIVLRSLPPSESTYHSSALPSVPIQNNYPAATLSSANSRHSIATSASSPALAPTQSIDSNTLAAVYSLLQPKPAPVRQYQQPNQAHTATNTTSTAAITTPPAQYQMPQQQQPTVSQLLATLLNGLNQNNGSISSLNSATASLSISPKTTNLTMSAPFNMHQPQPQVQPPPPSQQQPNIAQLLSTALNGNPLVAQLLSSQPSLANNSNMMNDNQIRNILANYQLMQPSSNQPRSSSTNAPSPTAPPTIPNSNSFNLTTMARH